MSLQELLGSELPLIQAPMAGSQDHRLAAAVCQAGGLGSIPCAMLTPVALRQELQAMRELTERPFNLNFFSHVPPEPDAAREATWRQALAPYYAELGVDQASIASGPGRLPMEEFASSPKPNENVSLEGPNLDVILDIPVNISMEVGSTEINIRNLLQLNQGSVIELDRLAGEPLDVLVNGTLIAHGEVVVVNEKFGIRLTDVISPSERIKKLR